MELDYDNYNGCTSFDSRFNNIGHFKKFPEMKPWIGRDFKSQPSKILIIGESHYFNNDIHCHHDAKSWYEHDFPDDLSKRIGHRLRYLISNSINTNIVKGAHKMYRNIHTGLLETQYFKDYKLKKQSPFNSVSYINYFQRPAQRRGKSIVIDQLDMEKSEKIIQETINIIKPDIVMFASVKAFNTAKKSHFFNNIEAQIDYTSHPCSPNWNKKSKKYGKFKDDHKGLITGKQRFIIALDNLIN